MKKRHKYVYLGGADFAEGGSSMRFFSAYKSFCPIAAQSRVEGPVLEAATRAVVAEAAEGEEEEE